MHSWTPLLLIVIVVIVSSSSSSNSSNSSSNSNSIGGEVGGGGGDDPVWMGVVASRLQAELLQQFADLELQAAGITNTRECEEVQMESSPIGGWPCGAQEDELGTDSIIRWF
jgi:hypothetical protein